jgi:uncharacterized protein YchJ
MVISEERHAAGARLGFADYRFDDPGCLVEFLAAEESGAAVGWVHDERSRWLEVGEAWYVSDPDRGTPMGSGLLAYGSEGAAAAAAERFGSEVQCWAGVAAPAEDG